MIKGSDGAMSRVVHTLSDSLVRQGAQFPRRIGGSGATEIDPVTTICLTNRKLARY